MKMHVTVSARVAWWVVPYIRMCVAFYRLTGIEPNVDAVIGVAMRGVILESK